jgi:hypothetical protein
MAIRKETVRKLLKSAIDRNTHFINSTHHYTLEEIYVVGNRTYYRVERYLRRTDFPIRELVAYIVVDSHMDYKSARYINKL